MRPALSVDLRERVVAAVSAGASCHQAAARFGVSLSSASRWSERYRSKGLGPGHAVATGARSPLSRTLA
jgi:transposase